MMGTYPAGNMLLSFAILMAGASISKILLVFRLMKQEHSFITKANLFFLPYFIIGNLISWHSYHPSEQPKTLCGLEMEDLIPWDILQSMECTQ